jgi:hypothetical protein
MINRFFVWLPVKHYQFIDYTEGTSWNGRPLEYGYKSVSYDSGSGYGEEHGHLLFSANFYKESDTVNHSFKAETIVDVIAALGGMIKII